MPNGNAKRFKDGVRGGKKSLNIKLKLTRKKRMNNGGKNSLYPVSKEGEGGWVGEGKERGGREGHCGYVRQKKMLLRREKQNSMEGNHQTKGSSWSNSGGIGRCTGVRL